MSLRCCSSMYERSQKAARVRANTARSAGATSGGQVDSGDCASARVSGIVFVFQAEDGIRDIGVTGVQTCALPILEDNPYGLLRYEGEPLPTLHSLDGGVYVMYLGTFSKILSPGIRLGWVAAPPPVLEKINLGKQAADLCTSTLSQLLVRAYFDEGIWREYVDALNDIYRRRRDAMLDALAEFFPPQAEWTRPAGGLFIWVTLPDFIDTTDLLARALRENVAFVPGEAAYLDGRGRSSMRLNFSAIDEDTIREGVRRIGEVVAEQVALYGTLTGEERPAARRPAPKPAAPKPPAAQEKPATE